MITRVSNVWKNRVLALGLVLVLLVVVGRIAMRLIVDTDEAYYLLAGQQLIDGALPYRDFFFPQMPLSAIVFGAWQGLVGRGFVAGRLLGAALVVAIVMVTVQSVRSRVDRRTALVAVGYLVLCAWAVTWMVRAKTYGLSALLILLAVHAAARPDHSPWSDRLSGLFVGLAVCARLLLAPLAVVLVLAPWLRRGDGKSALRASVRVALGAVLGLLPAFGLWAMDPKAFWFNNVTYHALRSGGPSLVEDWDQKGRVLLQGFGFGSWPGCTPMVVMAGLCALGLWTFWRRAEQRHLLVYPVAMLVVHATSYLPSPVYVQYFTVGVPLCIVGAALWVASQTPVWRRAFWLGLVPSALLFLARDASDLFFHADVKTPAALDAVGAMVRRATEPSDTVAANWELGLVAAERRMLPCSDNVFARRPLPGLPRAEAAEHHLCTYTQLGRAVLGGDVRAYVSVGWEQPHLESRLEAAGWRAIDARLATVWIAPKVEPDRAR